MVKLRFSVGTTTGKVSKSEFYSQRPPIIDVMSTQVYLARPGSVIKSVWPPKQPEGPELAQH